jgi:hypothetical protein
MLIIKGLGLFFDLLFFSMIAAIPGNRSFGTTSARLPPRLVPISCFPELVMFCFDISSTSAWFAIPELVWLVTSTSGSYVMAHGFSVDGEAEVNSADLSSIRDYWHIYA